MTHHPDTPSREGDPPLTAPRRANPPLPGRGSVHWGDHLLSSPPWYVISVSLIAGCPGLVPGWRAFPAIYRVLLPTSPPVLSRPSRVSAWARKDRGRGARWQLRIVAVYRAPPRHKTGAASETLNRYPLWGGDRGGFFPSPILHSLNVRPPPANPPCRTAEKFHISPERDLIPTGKSHKFSRSTAKSGSSTFSVVHCGGDVEFTDGEVEHGD